MKKIEKYILIVFFMGLLCYLFVSNLSFEKVDRLYFENRKIEEKLPLNSENVFSGDYFRNLEERGSDTFYGREDLLKLSTRINLKLLRRPIINDLYIKDDLILSVWKDWNKPYPEKKIQLMTQNYGNLSRDLKDKDIDFLYVGIPEHSSVYSYEYADYLHNKGDEWLSIEADFFAGLKDEGVNSLLMRDYLKDDIGRYYNATDHHFSYHGAVKTYEKIVDSLNEISGFELDASGLRLKKLDKNFKGSYSKKLFYQDDYYDETLIYEDDLKYRRFDNGVEVEPVVFQSLDFEYGTYEMYMGGDVAFTEIDTERQDLPNILIYGDSFTNPIESLMIRNANKLWSVDFRHYEKTGLLDLIDDLKPDLVICIRDNLMYVDREGNGLTK